MVFCDELCDWPKWWLERDVQIRSLCVMDYIPHKTKLLTTGVLLRFPHQSGSEISPHSATDFFPHKTLCLCLHQDPVLQGMSPPSSGSLEMSQCSTQAISVPSHFMMPNGQNCCQNFPHKMTLQNSSGGCLLVSQQVGRAMSRAIFWKPFYQLAPRTVHPQEQHVQPSATGRNFNMDPNTYKKKPNRVSRAASHHFKRGLYQACILSSVQAGRRTFA